MKRKDFEVMAPVGSYESLEAALQAGANSVYFGVEGLNMRSRSSANFTLDDLRNIVERCNAREVKTYLTVNTIIYNNELEKMHQVIECAKDAGVSAIIASDIAAILYARSIGVEVHISTQCNITNYEAVKFYAQFADVVVLARELDMDFQLEVMAGHSGTNGWPLQVSREGVATAVLSLPLRYMHTPVETVSCRDLEATAELLAAFIRGIGREVPSYA